MEAAGFHSQSTPPWLEEVAAASPWCVVVGRPTPQLLAQVQRCAGPLLVVVPDAAVQEHLERQLCPWPERMELRVCCVGATAAEVDWFVFNDSRFNGTVPLEKLRPSYPNLQLLGEEKRQQLPLATLLEEASPERSRGLVVLVDDPEMGMAALAELGSSAALIAAVAVLPCRGVMGQADLDQVFDSSACLKPTQRDVDGWLWVFDPQRRLAVVEQERDALKARSDDLEQRLGFAHQERDALKIRVDDLEQRMERINQELDEILGLIDAAEADQAASS